MYVFVHLMKSIIVIIFSINSLGALGFSECIYDVRTTFRISFGVDVHFVFTAFSPKTINIHVFRFIYLFFYQSCGRLVL